MKKIIFPLLAITVLTGCSKRADPNGEIPGVQVPIVLHSGVLLTKAPIVDNTTFTASVAGWESTTGSADYTASSKWVSTASVKASQAAIGITLVPQRFYNLESAKTYMKAWYPSSAGVDGQIIGGQVSFSGVDYKTDGTMDVLLASQIVGDKTDVLGKNLEFRHLLSQVSFKVVADGSLSPAPTLKSITIRNAELPTGINLVTDALIYASAADLPILDITPNIIIDATAKSAGSPAMFKPFAGKTFVISVETSEHKYDDATVTIDDTKFLPGTAYTITVTFKTKTEIKLSASVSKWLTGSGSVTVE